MVMSCTAVEFWFVAILLCIILTKCNNFVLTDLRSISKERNNNRTLTVTEKSGCGINRWQMPSNLTQLHLYLFS